MSNQRLRQPRWSMQPPWRSRPMLCLRRVRRVPRQRVRHGLRQVRPCQWDRPLYAIHCLGQLPSACLQRNGLALRLDGRDKLQRGARLPQRTVRFKRTQVRSMQSRSRLRKGEFLRGWGLLPGACKRRRLRSRNPVRRELLRAGPQVRQTRWRGVWQARGVSRSKLRRGPLRPSRCRCGC